MTDPLSLEHDVRSAAATLGDLEVARSGEYLRLVHFENVKPWEASMRADAEYAARIRNAQADYDVAVNRLRRASCR